jgi:ABC-type nitrate/sulfonate/bicarbonate transport system substrate-binding protein
MGKRVMIVGLRPELVRKFREQLDLPDVEMVDGTGPEDVRAAFAAGDIDHVFLGGGLGLDSRVALVAEVFQSSDLATVHLKDHQSGPEGFVPFVRAVLAGLRDYEPAPSPHAVLRADRGPSASSDA